MVDALAFDDQALEAFALNRQTGSRLHKSEVGLGKPGEPTELGPVYLAEIAEASRVGRSQVPRGQKPPAVRDRRAALGGVRSRDRRINTLHRPDFTRSGPDEQKRY